MWGMQIFGSFNKTFTQFKGCFGYAMAVLNYRQHCGVWKSVSWDGTTVAQTALISVDNGESIELTDIVIATDKVQNAVITLEFSDGTNSETLIIGDTTDAPLIISLPIAGKMHAWKNASLYYTVAVGSSTGSILIGYVKHPSSNSEDYSFWASRR